jgi:hypothetical protein
MLRDIDWQFLLQQAAAGFVRRGARTGKHRQRGVGALVRVACCSSSGEAVVDLSCHSALGPAADRCAKSLSC